jgi:hypothetical protein
MGCSRTMDVCDSNIEVRCGLITRKRHGSVSRNAAAKLGVRHRSTKAICFEYGRYGLHTSMPKHG